jgi:hypothetical protein
MSSRTASRLIPLLLLLATCDGPRAPAPPARPPGASTRPAPARPERVALRVDTGEAEAVLALVDQAARGSTTDAAWGRLFDSEGYRRLDARERSMQRSFDRDDMRAFVLSAKLAARAPSLRAALAGWAPLDLEGAAGRVLPYLPDEARIAATVFPVIKPRDNSFVYFGEGIEPSIFVYIDPAQTPAQLASVIAHELHHIGFASLPEVTCRAPRPVCSARTWAGAFGEGFAMLAAAGGPGVHPHAASPADVRARWDRDVARFDDNLILVQDFLRAVLAGELDEAATQKRAMELFGVQGPWYTVGWTMAVAIERCLGRADLVRTMRRPWTVLGRFNLAVERCRTSTGRRLATWDRGLVDRLDRE